MAYVWITHLSKHSGRDVAKRAELRLSWVCLELLVSYKTIEGLVMRRGRKQILSKNQGKIYVANN